MGHPTANNTPADVIQSVKDFREGRETRISTMRAIDNSGAFTKDGALRRKPKRPAHTPAQATA